MKYTIDQMIQLEQDHIKTSQFLITKCKIPQEQRRYEIESIEIRKEIIKILQDKKDEKEA